jgi:hypothetical protein
LAAEGAERRSGGQVPVLAREHRPPPAVSGTEEHAMCELTRFMIANIATGSAIGWITAGTLLATNASGLRDMVLASANPPVVLAMIALPVGGLFGICYLATALMFLAEDE